MIGEWDFYLYSRGRILDPNDMGLACFHTQYS
jgi:hypothetical protein